jgi:hypothetical protein
MEDILFFLLITRITRTTKGAMMRVDMQKKPE